MTYKHANVYSGFICILEMIQMPINRWMDKQIVVHLNNEILFLNKKEQTDTCDVN